MKQSINEVKLTGQVQGDIAGVEYESGLKMVHFDLATRDTFLGFDGSKEDSLNWHKIQAFGKLAEVCERYVRHEKMVSVTGKLVNVKETYVIQISEILIVNGNP